MNTFAIRRSDDDQFYVVEKAANGEIINTSEMYPTRSNALRAARTRMALYLVPPVIRDETGIFEPEE